MSRRAANTTTKTLYVTILKKGRLFNLSTDPTYPDFSIF